MKPLTQLLNVDKAKLLHELFPGLMPELVFFIKQTGSWIKENEEECRHSWNIPFLSFEQWLRLIDIVENEIDKKEAKLGKSATAFSQSLFDGLLAVFCNHCLQLYTAKPEMRGSKFTKAVDLLFDLYPTDWVSEQNDGEN